MPDRRRACRSPSFAPLYLQIKALLEKSLEAREWRPGEAIPSEIELARRYGVSQGTVRKAIDALAADNLVVRRQGKGTFVATHTEERSSLFRFLRIRRNDGGDVAPVSRLLDVKRAQGGRRRRAPARAQARRRRAGPAAGARVRGRAGGARRDHAARGAVPRPDQGALRRLPRLDVQLLRKPVRRAHAEGAGEDSRGRGRRRDRAHSRHGGRARRCWRSIA